MSPLLRLVPLVALFAVVAPAQDLNEKAARYYETLLKRPAAGPVFDRFVDAWLDSGTLDQLETFLAERIKAGASAPGHVLLALYYVRQGSHAKAVEQYRAALALEPANAALWQQKALAESRLLEFDQAIASLEEGLKQKPAEDLALGMRQLQGRLYSRAGRPADALKVWEDLLRQHPDDEALREDVLELQLAEGHFDAAGANAAALVELAPDPYKKAMRRLLLAEVLDRAGRTDAAMEELAKCLADSGADSWLEKEVLARLDRIFRRDDNLSGLRTHLEALTKQFPQRHSLARAQVRLLAELGEKTAAVDAGRALLALAPGDRTAREEFIALLVESGRLEEAVAQTAELVKQAPQDRDLLLKLASLKLQAGDKPGCLAAVTEYDRISGADEAARLRGAALLEKAGLAEDAVTRLKAAAQEFPSSAAVSGALASALHRARRRDEALAEWRRMAAAVTGPALLDVARTLSAHGEDETAWELLLTKAAAGEAPLLTQLCQLAERLDRAAEAVPHARRLVPLAQTAPDIEAALELASRLIKRAGEADEVIASIGQDAGVADLFLLAELLELRGDSAAAESALQRAAPAAPELAAAQLVRLYRLRQAWPQALEAGAKLFASPGGRKAATARMLADIAERSRDLETALQWTREWRKLSPGAAPAVLAESRLLRAMGRDDAALQSLRQASGQFDENREIREELARLSRDTGRTAEALSLYAGLYEQSQEASAKLRVIHEWAEAAQEANRTAELLEQFEERRRQNRNATGPLLALAEIHSVNGDREKQRRALTDAARLRPGDADLALSLAAMQAEDDLIPLAMETLRAALPHDKSGRVRHRLARLHFDAGDQLEGLKLLEEPEDGNPPDVAAVESMALALTLTDPQRAIALLEPRIAADPADYRLRFLRASIQAELGRHSEAVREWTALLAVKQESPAVTARRGSSLFSPAAEAQLKTYTGAVPEDLLHVLRVQDLLSTDVRQQWNARYNPGGSGPSTQFQPRLPGSVAELRALVTATLLSSGRDEELTKLSAAALAGDGMAELATLVAALDESDDPFAPGTPLRQNRELLEELKKPGFGARDGKPSPVTGGTLVFRSLTGDHTAPDASTTLTIWSEWRPSHPDFALAAVIAGLRDSPVLLEHERTAVEMFLSQERPHDLVLQSAVKYVKQGGIRSVDGGKVHRAILDRIAGWLESDWITAPPLLQTRRHLAENLLGRLSDRPEIVARIFNAEWPREWRGGPPKTAQISGGWTNYSPLASYNQSASGTALLTPLAWPPAELPGVSPLFFGGEGASDLASRLTAEDAARTAPLVKQPVLRAWLEDRAAAKGHPVAAVTALARGPNAETAAVVLAAVSAAEAEQYAAATVFAQQALERPLSGNLRRMLNASIVAWADEAMPDFGSELHTAAREAALRLRRDAQTNEQKAELAEAMEMLGLTEEAKALMSGPSVRMWARYGARYFSSRGAAGAGRVQLMMREAKRELTSGSETAAATAARVVRRQARYLLSPAGWDGGFIGSADGRYFSGSTEDDVNWPDLLKLMQEEARAKAIMQSIEQETRGEVRRRAVLAAAHEVFDQTDQALAIYRELRAGGTAEPGVLVRLALLLHRLQRTEESGEVFVSAPPAARAWLAAGFLRDGKRAPLDEVLRVAALTTASLERDGAAPPADTDWLCRLVTLLREDLILTDNLRAPELEGPDDGEPMRRPDRPDASTEELQSARERLAARRAAHDALCRRLLHVPGAAAVAFQSLRIASPAEADLSAEAVRAFVTGCLAGPSAPAVLSAAGRQQQAMMRVIMADRDTAGEGFNLIEPPAAEARESLDYLLQRSVQNNSPDVLRLQLIPALTESSLTKQAEQAALLTSLYFDAMEQVEENARRLLASGGPAVWPAVLSGLEHRRATPDLGAAAAGEVTRARSRPDDLPAATRVVEECCAWMCRTGHHDRGRALLERVLDVLTGTGRQRAQAFAGAIGGGLNQFIYFMGGGGTAAAPPALEAMELLKRLIAIPATAFVALDAVHDSIIPLLPSDTASALTSQLDLRNAPYTGHAFFLNPEHTRQFFTGSPLVAEVEQFRSYGGAGGLFFSVAGALYEMGFEERKPALEVLRSLPAAFGRDMLIAAASDRWNAGVLNVAAEHMAAIQSLSAPAQAELADLLAALASGRELLHLTDAGQSLMTWVSGQQSLMISEEMAKRIEQFVSAGSAGGRGVLSRQDPVEMAAPLLEAAIKGMSPRAYDVVRRVSVLSPRPSVAQRMGSLLAGYDGEFSPAWVDSGATPADAMPPLPPDRAAFRLGLLTDTLAAGDKRAPLFIEPLRIALPRTVRWISNKFSGTPEEQLTALTTALAAPVKEGEACVLLEAFPLPVTRSDTPESRAALRAAAIAWADGAGKSLPRQDIVREIAAAARLEEFMERQPHAAGLSDETALPPEQAHYLAVMRDESRGPVARLAVASLLADFAGPWLEPPVLAQCGVILERSLATRRPVDAWQRSAIVRVLARSAPSPAIDAVLPSLLPRLPLARELKDTVQHAEAREYLMLALRSNDRDAVFNAQKRLQTNGNDPDGDPDVLGIVLSAGDAFWISRLVSDAKSRTWYPERCSGEVLFDQRVEAGLALAVKDLPDDHFRLRLELSVHCLPSAAGMPSRVERMQALAARAAPLMESASSGQRRQLLDLLAEEPAAAIAQRQYYEEEVPESGWKDLFDTDRSQNQPRHLKRFWLATLFTDAAAGDIARLTRRMDLINESPPADPFAAPGFSDSAEFSAKALHRLCTGIAHGWPQWDATTRAAVQQWIIGRLKSETLPAADTNTGELSKLPVELIEAINREVP